MENENYQKELFEFKATKKATAGFGNIFQRNDLAIVLTAEKMVFAAIGMIMLMVVFFALGVEKGKAASHAAARAPKEVIRDIIVSPVAPVKTSPSVSVVKPKPVVTVTNITPKTSPKPAAREKARAASGKSKPYTVVAGAFLREDFALREVDKLRANGLEAFVYYVEPYYLACVGAFRDTRSAKKVLSKVKRMRWDAYVKLR